MNLVIEMMSNEQLDQVSGGTCQQTDELIRAIGPVDVRVKGGHTTTKPLTGQSTGNLNVMKSEII